MDLVQTVKDSFELYRAFNDAHPVLGSMATASIIFPTADIASQYLGDRYIDWHKVRYTSLLSPVYGLATYFCIQSKELVPEWIKPQELAEAVETNLVGGILFNGFFFVNNTVGERTGYNIGKLVEHYGSLFSENKEKTNWKERLYGLQHKLCTIHHSVKEKIFDCIPYQEYAKAFLGSITLWNAFQYANFFYVKPELQTPATLGVALAWTITLSAWSLRGRRSRRNHSCPSDHTNSPTPLKTTVS